MRSRNPMVWFSEYASREPGHVRKIFTVLLGIAMSAAIWERRGPVAGLVAVAVYGVGFAVTMFRFEQTLRWSRKHPILEGLYLILAGFLALAYLSDLSLLACLLVAAAASLVLIPLQIWLRRFRPTPTAH